MRTGAESGPARRTERGRRALNEGDGGVPEVCLQRRRGARRRRDNEGPAQQSFPITADAGPRRNSSACHSSITAVSLRRAVTREEGKKRVKEREQDDKKAAVSF